MEDAIELGYVTCPSVAVARDLAGKLLAGKWAACANLVPGVVSLYEWKGELCDDEEVVMFFKTTTAKREGAIACVEAAHPYEVPCVVTWPLGAGHAPFLDWVREQTRGNARGKEDTPRTGDQL